MGSEVFGESSDAFGENGDLNFSGSGVFLVFAVFSYDLFLGLGLQVCVSFFAKDGVVRFCLRPALVLVPRVFQWDTARFLSIVVCVN